MFTRDSCNQSSWTSFSWTPVTKDSGFRSHITAVLCGSESKSCREARLQKYWRLYRRPLSFPHMDPDTDHTHIGENSCVRKRVCVTQDISSRKRTMGRTKQSKKEFILLGIAQQGGEWAELSGSYHWGWRVRVAQCRGGVWALCVYWEVPTMKVCRLDVLKSSVSVLLSTPHASHPKSEPPGPTLVSRQGQEAQRGRQSKH